MITSLVELEQWFNSPYEYLDRKSSQVGNTFILNLPTMKGTLVTGDQFLIDSISKNSHLIGGVGSKFLHHLVGTSVITQYGEEHQATRKKLNPIFFQNIDSELVEKLSQKNTMKFLDLLKTGESISITEWANLVTLSTIIDFLLDDLEEETKNELFHLVIEWKKTVSLSAYFFLKPMQINFSSSFGWGKYIAHRTKVQQFILGLIKSRPKNLGLLSKMIHEFNWTEEQILYEFISVLMFGHDTSAILIGWWTRHLLTYHKWDHDLPKSLIESSLKETARFTPPVVHLTRVATEDTKVGQYIIKKDQKVFPCIYLSHMNENSFPKAKEFQIERFESKNYSPNIYYPFGFGDRICLGKKFAEIQTLEIAKILLQQKKFKLTNKDVPAVRQFFLMVPENGTMVTVL